MNPLRVLVWGENIHEQQDAAVAAIYPRGMHVAIAEGIREFLPTAAVSTATLQEREHGLSAQRLATTDVLTWWGHRGHADVSDEVVERVQRRVLEGMGLIVLHSAHYSKIFKRLMGTTCSLTWRVAGERERLWVCNPGHPIAQGIDRYFELPQEETYGEPFAVPTPDEQVFNAWFEGGEEKNGIAQLVDWANAANDWLVVNQFEVVGQTARRPDLNTKPIPGTGRS